ncbi:MAG: DUF1353 domain-containing protein [Fimbriiglobus sp.]
MFADASFTSLPENVQENVLRVLGDPGLPPAEIERLLAWDEGITPANQKKREKQARSGRTAAAARSIESVRTAALATGSVLSAAANVGVTQPDIRYHPGTELWELLADYSIDDGDLGSTLTALKGYTCDLATVPRPLRWIISPYELGGLPPLFHDLIYEYRGTPQASLDVNPSRTFTRLDADDLFYRHMVLSGVSTWKRSLAYRTVRTFGGIWWAT